MSKTKTLTQAQVIARTVRDEALTYQAKYPEAAENFSALVRQLVIYHYIKNNIPTPLPSKLNGTVGGIIGMIRLKLADDKAEYFRDRDKNSQKDPSLEDAAVVMENPVFNLPAVVQEALTPDEKMKRIASFGVKDDLALTLSQVKKKAKIDSEGVSSDLMDAAEFEKPEEEDIILRDRIKAADEAIAAIPGLTTGPMIGDLNLITSKHINPPEEENPLEGFEAV